MKIMLTNYRFVQTEGKTRGHSKLWVGFPTNNFCQVHPCVHYIITTHSTNLKNYEKSIKFSFQRNLNLYLDYSNLYFWKGLAATYKQPVKSTYPISKQSRIIMPNMNIQKVAFLYIYIFI